MPDKNTDCGSIADEISDVARELRNGISTGEAGGRGVIAALGRLDSMAARVRGMECRSEDLDGAVPRLREAAEVLREHREISQADELDVLADALEAMDCGSVTDGGEG